MLAGVRGFTSAHELLWAWTMRLSLIHISRQMLGELYAVRGDLDRATELWSTVDNSAGQLSARLWWYAYVGEAEKAEQINEVLGRLGISTN